jgi:hypothetical protein
MRTDSPCKKCPLGAFINKKCVRYKTTLDCHLYSSFYSYQNSKYIINKPASGVSNDRTIENIINFDMEWLDRNMSIKDRILYNEIKNGRPHDKRVLSFIKKMRKKWLSASESKKQ